MAGVSLKINKKILYNKAKTIVASVYYKIEFPKSKPIIKSTSFNFNGGGIGMNLLYNYGL